MSIYADTQMMIHIRLCRLLDQTELSYVKWRLYAKVPGQIKNKDLSKCGTAHFLERPIDRNPSSLLQTG